MEKKPFVTKEQLEKIVEKYPTPFHLYDEKGIRQTARDLYKAFSWNEGFKEYFAVKATPTPAILKILKEEGCGTAPPGLPAPCFHVIPGEIRGGPHEVAL